MTELRGILIKRNGDAKDWDAMFQMLSAKNMNVALLQLNPTSWTGYQLARLDEAFTASAKYGVKIQILLPYLSYDPSYTAADENPYGNVFSGSNPDWRMVKADGTPVNCTCFNRESLKQRIKQFIDVLFSKYPQITGIAHDYIRMPTTDVVNESGIETKVCYCDKCKADFTAWLAANGKAPLNDWAEANYGGSRWSDFQEWRKIPLNVMVANVKAWASMYNPNLAFSACIWISASVYDPDPYAELIAQDPNGWVGSVDYVLPMSYHPDAATIVTEINNTKRDKTANGQIGFGVFLGIGGSEVGFPVITVETFKENVNASRATGILGFMIYQYSGVGWDAGEPYDIEPYLTQIAIIPLPSAMLVVLLAGAGTIIYFGAKKLK